MGAAALTQSSGHIVWLMFQEFLPTQSSTAQQPSVVQVIVSEEAPEKRLEMFLENPSYSDRLCFIQVLELEAVL